MAERPAVDASPLIYLARARLLDLLKLAGPEVIVPQAVAAEILRRGPSDPTARAIATTDWLTTVEVPETPGSIRAWDLGPGESAVLTWCHSNSGTVAIVDDRSARRCASAHGIAVSGTLGLVLVARQRGSIPAARPVLEHLRQIGMYLSDRVLEQALRRVGE